MTEQKTPPSIAATSHPSFLSLLRGDLPASLTTLFFGRSRRKARGETMTAPPIHGAEGTVGAAFPLPPGDSLLQGMQTFARDSAPFTRPLLEQLAREGQEPTELFITCADSRIVPSLITSSGPGDLFVVRNVGNLVPSALNQNSDVSVTAALDYALSVLKVKRIVVCGHSGCGAMHALLKDEIPHTNTPLGTWLGHGKKSMDRFRAGECLDRACSDADQLSQINVVQQLDTLRGFDSVREREASGEVELVGLFFDIAEARVLIYHPARRQFVPVDAAPGVGNNTPFSEPLDYNLYPFSSSETVGVI